MNASTQITSAERVGGVVGRLWKKWLRLDESVCSRLALYGVPIGLTKIVLWAVKLIVLGVQFYAAFWVALVLTIVAVAVGITRYADLNGLDEELNKTEWKYGPYGYGLYSSQGYRIDPHDEDDGEY